MWGWPSSLSSDLKLPEEHSLCWGLNIQGVTVGTVDQQNLCAG